MTADEILTLLMHANQLKRTAPTAPLMFLWEELHASETAEACLVHDADKIDMFLQALVYEEQTGNKQLRAFWAVPHRFHFPEVQAIYDRLRQMWEESI